MMRGELIEIVRKYPELYDTRHINYMKANFKNKIWSDIAKELKLTDAGEAKGIWLKLRACYRDARRRQHIKRCFNDQGNGENIRPWIFQEQMSFLEPFMLNMPLKKNIIDECEGNEDSQSLPDQFKTEMEFMDVETEDLAKEDFTTLETVQNTEEITDEERVSLNNVEDESNSNRGSVEIKLSSVNDPNLLMQAKKKTKFNNNIVYMLNRSIQLREKRAKQREEERKKLLEEKNSMEDPLYHFFMSMYQSTKRMSSEHQHTVRSQVFQAVSDAEANCMNFSANQEHNELPSSHNLGSSDDSTHLLQLNHEFHIKQELSNESLNSSDQEFPSLFTSLIEKN